MVPGVYILLCLQENKVHSSFLHIQLHNLQKDLNPCLLLYYYAKVIVQLEKNANNEFYCVYGACNLTNFK